MIVISDLNCNTGSGIPIRLGTPGVLPVFLLDVMERENLFAGLRGVSETAEGVALELGECAALERALRKWTASADEFAIAVGRAGFFIVTTTTVHLVRSRGPNHD